MKKILSVLLIALLAMSFAMAIQGEPKIAPEDEPMAPKINSQGEPEPMLIATNTNAKVANQGEDQQIKAQVQEKVQEKVMNGELTMPNGEKMQLSKQAENKMMLKANGIEATSTMEMKQENNKLQVKLSNGMNSEVKVMPDKASIKAMEQLKLPVCDSENNCGIELKEVGSGEEIRAAYQVKAQKEAKLFGFINTKMNVEADIDAQTGEVIRSKKTWWAFLASEE